MKTEFTIEEIREKLSHLKPDIIPTPEHQRPASVLVPFYGNENGLSLVFMMRPDYPGVHGGQISFPGGKRGAADKDDMSTALRETEEEIGVKRDDIDVLGRLSTFQARTSDFCVTPFVGQIPYPYEFRPDPEEVDRLIIVPFSHILNPKNGTFGEFDFKGYSFPSYMFSYKKDVIWGITARILNSFITFLRTGQESY